MRTSTSNLGKSNILNRMKTFILWDTNQFQFKRLREFFFGTMFKKLFSVHVTGNFVVPIAGLRLTTALQNDVMTGSFLYSLYTQVRFPNYLKSYPLYYYKTYRIFLDDFLDSYLLLVLHFYCLLDFQIWLKYLMNRNYDYSELNGVSSD